MRRYCPLAAQNQNMPRMTSEELRAYQLRRSPKTVESASHGVEQERTLHDEIKAECLRRGWYFVHNRMDKPTTFDGPRGTTVLDFVIAAKDGKTLWVEAKTATGKLSEEQAGTMCWLARDGHVTFVVRSFKEFLKMLEGVK